MSDDINVNIDQCKTTAYPPSYKMSKTKESLQNNKSLFVDLTFIVHLQIVNFINENNKQKKEMKQIRDTLTCKSIDPSNTIHLVVVCRVLSLSFYYLQKKI